MLNQLFQHFCFSVFCLQNPHKVKYVPIVLEADQGIGQGVMSIWSSLQKQQRRVDSEPRQSEYVEFKGAYYKAKMYLNFYALLYISCRCLYICIPVTVKYYFLSSKIDTRGICCLLVSSFGFSHFYRTAV